MACCFEVTRCVSVAVVVVVLLVVVEFEEEVEEGSPVEFQLELETCR